MKQNPAADFQRVTTLIQRRSVALKQRRNNVTQRCYNVASTLFQRTLNVVKATIMDFLMFQQILLSPQVKGSVIISNKHGI